MVQSDFPQKIPRLSLHHRGCLRLTGDAPEPEDLPQEAPVAQRGAAAGAGPGDHPGCLPVVISSH